MSKFKHLIFDFDGVICDSYEANYEFMLAEWPGISREEHRGMYEGNIFETRASMPQSILSDEEKEIYRRDVYWVKTAKCPTYPGLKDVLQKLSEKFQLSINSSSNSDNIENYLNNNNLKMFTDILGSDFSKSKVEKINHILAKYNLETDEVAFVTDTTGDILEANKVGVKSIAVSYGYHTPIYFQKYKSDIVLFAHTPAELLQLTT